jgi:hypothetical protein
MYLRILAVLCLTALYALSADAQSFGIDSAGVPQVSSVYTGGTKPYWTVHVRDTTKADYFIAKIDLLNDPLGTIKQRPNSDSGYVSKNVSFSPANFKVSGRDTAATFKIVVNDPSRYAEGWIRAANWAGNDTLVRFYYNDTCAIFEVTNVCSSAPYILTNEDIVCADSTTQIVSTTPKLPFQIPPSTTVKMNVCFSTANPNTVWGTVLSQTSCPSVVDTVIFGSTTLPEITATDYNFGDVRVGDSLCHTVRVSNTGKANFMLTKWWSMTDSSDFHLDGAVLPFVLQPGARVDLNVCYYPKQARRDSSIITWATDMSESQKEVKKNYSVLVGHGVVLGAVRDGVSPFEIHVSPNPVSNEISIDCSSSLVSSVEVLDILGNRITSPGQAAQTRIDSRAWPEGVYFVRVTSGERTITKRIVKAR